MSIKQLKTPARWPRHLAMAVVVAALGSATWVTPALAGGGNFGGSGPVNYSPPSINGSGLVGYSMTTSYGTWDNTASSYQVAWFLCDSYGLHCSAISGAAGISYTPQLSQSNEDIRSVVTAFSADGSSNAASSTPVKVWVLH